MEIIVEISAENVVKISEEILVLSFWNLQAPHFISCPRTFSRNSEIIWITFAICQERYLEGNILEAVFCSLHLQQAGPAWLWDSFPDESSPHASYTELCVTPAFNQTELVSLLFPRGKISPKFWTPPLPQMVISTYFLGCLLNLETTFLSLWFDKKKMMFFTFPVGLLMTCYACLIRWKVWWVNTIHYLLLFYCQVSVASTLRQQKRFKRNPEVAQVTDCLVLQVLPEQQQGWDRKMKYP